MFLFKRGLKNLNEIYSTANDVCFMKYPSFVYGRGVSEGEIPSFCFHSAEHGEFETYLQFLSENGYKTLTMDESYNIITKKLHPPKRAVLLTFDDGMGSVWSVAYPLLRKYGLKATVFLVPSRIRNREKYFFNLDDCWSGKTRDIEEVLNRDQSDQPFLTWEEIIEMHESGVIDFQSHTVTHSLIFTNSKIIDFVSPSLFLNFHNFEIPAIRENGMDMIGNGVRFGTPLYASASRVSGARRYFDDEGLRERCISFVQENGGIEFFENRKWRNELYRVAEQYRRPYLLNDRYETVDERDKAILYELEESKKLIEGNVPGKKVEHMAYPWGIGSNISMHLSRSLGYLSNLWVKVCDRYIPRVGDDPFKLARISSDFFLCLPGNDRLSLLGVVLNKFKKRLKSGSPYLTH